VFLGGVLSLLLRLLPGFYQQNQVTLALVLPFAAILSLDIQKREKTPKRSSGGRALRIPAIETPSGGPGGGGV
jgi:hypothetical protein